MIKFRPEKRAIKWMLLCAVAALAWFPHKAGADQVIYDGALENGWQNWSWASVNFLNTAPVYTGSYSISVSCTNFSALYLHATAFDSSGFTNLSFWINGGLGGQPLQVQVTSNGLSLSQNFQFSAPTNAWQKITIPLSSLGASSLASMDGFWIQSRTGSELPPFYLDDISLTSLPTSIPTNPVPVTVAVDAMANRHSISPLVYGVAWASSNDLAALNCPINRAGGNAETRYNWQLNAHNHANDWFFESIADSPATPGANDDDFVANSKNGGAMPMITVPMIGWMPKLGPNRASLDSYSVAKYGAQTATDPYWSDAGNGVSQATGLEITNNNPNDANFPTNVTFQQGFVNHLIQNWGPSTRGGVPFYIMDNEESIWFSTHRDVHPVGPTMQEIYDDFITYAAMVKAADPSALVCGFEEWGWNGYLYSGYDQQNPGGTDRAAHGGWDYMPWLLNQIHQHDLSTGTRLLDYFTVHCYPQEGNVSSGSDVSPATAALRNRTTRVFWDTNYVDPSWINNVIMLIPRMQAWVQTNYPGTKIGITEYNWGAETNINGATAQADILGIFGWQGLDLATRWVSPAPGSPTFHAMQMFRNYDGNRSVFGDTSVQATAPQPDQLAAYAAIRSSDGALTLMVINKDLTNACAVTSLITNFNAAGPVTRWQLTASNQITPLTSLIVTHGQLTDTVPAQSITLYVIPPLAPFTLQVAQSDPASMVNLWLNGQSGQSYTLQTSTDLRHWTPLQTNILTSNRVEWVLPATNSIPVFYRGVWQSP